MVRTRAVLYNSGILPTFRLHHPVISVGNLTVGGTGKTPLVIALAERLRNDGFRPIVLSRGYRRTSHEILVVNSDWDEAGDEPYMMKQRLGNIPVVVGANRYRAGLFAEERGLGDVFILDDGFQHRRLHRDVDLVTIDPSEWAHGEVLLPAGRWREPKSAIVRAQAACVQQIRGVEAPSLPVPSFTVQTEIEGIFHKDAVVPIDDVKGRSVIAFAGIAKPERFFTALESLGIYPAKRVRFPDHYRYSARDIEKLGGEIRITTEKDAVRLAGLDCSNFMYLRISAKIPDFDRLMTIILSRLPKR